MTIAERYSIIARVERIDGIDFDEYFNDEDEARSYAYHVCDDPEVSGVEILILDWLMHQETSLDWITA